VHFNHSHVKIGLIGFFGEEKKPKNF